MPRVNVAKVIKNPNFAQKYSIFRKSGKFVKGVFVQSETEIKVTGVVTAPSSNDIIQIAEADRVTGIMCFHSNQEIFVTRDSGTSDEILWRGSRYRIFRVVQWGDYGYWKALGVSMSQNGS